jgi:hypothetical protein
VGVLAKNIAVSSGPRRLRWPVEVWCWPALPMSHGGGGGAGAEDQVGGRRFRARQPSPGAMHSKGCGALAALSHSQSDVRALSLIRRSLMWAPVKRGIESVVKRPLALLWLGASDEFRPAGCGDGCRYFWALEATGQESMAAFGCCTW